MLDGRVVGTTPYQEEFRSYGTRRVEFRLENHELLVSQICLEQPWWQYPPFDLFTDILLPFTFHSEFTFDWELSPRGETATLEDARAAYERMQNAVENLPRDNP